MAATEPAAARGLAAGAATGGTSEVLTGRRLTPETITAAAEAAAGPSKPLDNTDFTHPYRKRLTRVYVARALARLAGLDAGAAGEELA